MTQIAHKQHFKTSSVFINECLKSKWLLLLFLIHFLSLSCLYSQSDHMDIDKLINKISTSNGIDKVNALNKVASYYGGNKDSVVHFSNLAYELASQLDYELGKAKSFLIKGGMYNLSGKNDKAIEFFDRALKIYIELDQHTMIGECLNGKGRSLVAKSRYSEALVTYNRVSDYSDSIQIAKSYKNIGLLIADKGDPSRSMEFFYKSIEICKRNNNQREIANNYTGIAIVKLAQDDLEQALNYFIKARVIYEKLGNRMGIANCHNNIGRIYGDQEEYDKAVTEFESSLEVYQKLNVNHGKAIVNLNIGLVYYEQKNYEVAKEYFLKAQKTSELVDIESLECGVLEFGAKVLNKTGHRDEAIRNYEKSLMLAKKLSLWSSIMDVSTDLVKIYKNERDYEKALEYHELYANSKDSLISVEESKEIERLKFSFDLSNIENELALQKAEVLLLEKEKHNAKLTSGLLIAGSILLIVFATFSFIRHRKINRIQKQAMDSEKAFMKVSLEKEKLKRDQLNEVIVYKNKQLTDLAIHITEKNDLLERFKENIKSVKKNVKGKKVIGLLQDLLVNIIQDIDMNKERIAFYKEIEDLNQTFLYTLNKKFPALSDRELKLAALLRVNLTTKRIAVLMGLSPISVDIYRHNLRKKIGLDKGTSLYDFFNKLEE